MERDRCYICRWAPGWDLLASGAKCDFAERNGISRGALLCKERGIQRPNEEVRRILRSENCPFFEENPQTREYVTRRFLGDSKGNADCHGPAGLAMTEEREPRKAKKPKRKRTPRYDWTRARTLYDAGKSDREIAEVIGCTPPAVRDWRRREELPSKWRGGDHAKSEKGPDPGRAGV